MTLDKLIEMNMTDILRKINLMQHKLNKTTEFMRRRRLERAQIQEATWAAVARGEVIPLYYRDEFTGLHYRATPAKFVLHNTPTDGSAA